jgi:hypothetical protein
MHPVQSVEELQVEQGEVHAVHPPVVDIKNPLEH